jgi:hypothetical protein
MSRVVRPFPAFLLTATIIFGTATFIAVPLLLAQTLLAQNGDPAKAPEAGKGEATKGEAAKSDAAKSEAAKSEAAKSEAAKSDAAKGDAAKGEAAKGEPAKGEAAKGEGAKAEPPKAEAGKADAKEAGGRPDESADTARILIGPAGRGECVWFGKRVVGLLWKDDLDTAMRHLKLYDRFGCPGEHLQLSFRCIVRQGDIQKDAAKEPKIFDKTVDACWLNPATPAPPANQPTVAVEKPGTK